MEATILELWQEYCRKYLAKYGECPRIRITTRDALILALLDLETPDEPDDYDFD
jgi:hypothetical protein